jgi:hypothetical protein
VIDEVKGGSGDDGTALMELVPGRHTFSMSRHGCADQVEHIDLVPGTGVENFKFVFTCEKK